MFSMCGFLKQFRLPAVMGIVNASGDSFSEGINSRAESALDRALQLLDDGADLLDLGGESTRPGAAEVSPQEEIARVVPVLKNLKSLRPDTVCSVDTRHAETARAALDAGAEIINDVSMLRHAPDIAPAAAEYQAAMVLTHSRGTPENMMSAEFCNYPDGVALTAAREIAVAVDAAVNAGVKVENILLDPGFGFAKNPGQCWELAGDLEKFASPAVILAGVSRKAFLGELTGEKNPVCRDSATLALELELARRGVAVIRTHNVRALRRGLQVVQKLQEK